jgi:protein SCO1/2
MRFRQLNFLQAALIFAAWSPFPATLVFAKEPALRGQHSTSLYSLTDEWGADTGETLRLKELRGQVVVLAMVYSSCASACPMIIEDMKKIQKGLSLPAGNATVFVGVTLDPDRDTTAGLKSFRVARALDGRWKLLRGASSSVRKLAALLGIQYRKDRDGSFQHSYEISVLSREGKIVFQQAGAGHAPTEAVSAIEKELSSQAEL